MQLRGLFSSSSALAIIVAGFAFSGETAHAQSTGTLQMEEIVVSADKLTESLNGLIKAEEIPKARSEVNQEFLRSEEHTSELQSH